MRPLLQIVSLLALATTVVPGFLFLAGRLELEQVKWQMLAATIVWFVVAPLWMGRTPQASDDAAAT